MMRIGVFSLLLGLTVWLPGVQADADLTRWERELDYKLLVEQGQTYVMQFDASLPPGATATSIRSAGIRLKFSDDDATTRTSERLDLINTTTTESRHPFYVTEIKTTTKVFEHVTTHTTTYTTKQHEAVVASVAGSSKEGSNSPVQQERAVTRTVGETERQVAYSNSMDASKVQYDLNLFSAFFMGLANVVNEDWGGLDYSGYLDYREKQWERYEVTETTEVVEYVSVHDGWSAGFTIDLLFDRSTIELLIRADVVDLRLFGQLGDTHLVSAEFWVEYIPVPSAPTNLRVE